MAKYLLLLHGPPVHGEGPTPEELQRVAEMYRAWAGPLAAAGKMVDGFKLADEGGRSVSRGAGGVVVMDGPYTEAREVVGGLFVLEAASYAEAEEMARGCPALERGARLELRAVEPT
jgi:hypothetical protein